MKNWTYFKVKKVNAFGRERCPYDLETIADLEKLIPLFYKRGYSKEDVNNIIHDNWLRFLKNAWR